MTEDDATAMAAAVLAAPIDPESERAWAQTAQNDLRRQEQRLMAEWKMWRYLRDDARMTAIATELTRVRACLVYLMGVVGDDVLGAT